MHHGWQKLLSRFASRQQQPCSWLTNLLAAAGDKPNYFSELERIFALRALLSMDVGEQG